MKKMILLPFLYLYSLIYISSLWNLIDASETAVPVKMRVQTSEQSHMSLLEHKPGLHTLLMSHGGHILTWTQNSPQEQFCLIRDDPSLVTSYQFLYGTPGTADVSDPNVAIQWTSLLRGIFGWTDDTRRVDFLNPEDLMRTCLQNPEIHRNNIGDSRRSRRNAFIMPATKWCGKGNMAQGFNDTGESIEADTCCRNHDHCPVHITAFNTYKGYKSYYPYTISSCECDDDFYMCLQNANRRVANHVGAMYFNYLKIPCFKVVKRKTCVEYKWLWTVCVKYERREAVQLYHAQVYVSGQ